MSVRMIDYYVKNLTFDARQEIFGALEKVNVLSVEKCWKKKRDIRDTEVLVIRTRISHVI